MACLLSHTDYEVEALVQKLIDEDKQSPNPPTPEKPPMPLISSYLTVDESAEEHDTCDAYLTEGFLTEKEQQQLALDEKAYREYLEEAKAENERARAEN
nr:hypothetical protein [Tanacetum cinerariifolium]